MKKEKVIIKSKNILQKVDNKPDAGGNYRAFPIQFFFLIVHGVNTNGHIELIRSVRHKSNLYVNKNYPEIKMRERSGNCGYFKGEYIPFSVSIKSPKDFNKITGGDFKSIILNKPIDQDGQEYKGEFTYYFKTFEEANQFYLVNCEKLNLTDFTYKNDRYMQHIKNVAPKWTKEIYYELIKSNVI
jgi:hypothetical protein